MLAPSNESAADTALVLGGTPDDPADPDGLAWPAEQIRTTKSRFLEALSQGKTILRSCEVAGISRGTAYAWKNYDTQFAVDWGFAQEDDDDGVREVLREEALVGKTVKRFTKDGKFYDEWTERNPTLIRHMSTRLPEYHRNALVQINNGPGRSPGPRLSEAQAAALSGLARQALGMGKPSGGMGKLSGTEMDAKRLWSQVGLDLLDVLPDDNAVVDVEPESVPTD